GNRSAQPLPLAGKQRVTIQLINTSDIAFDTTVMRPAAHDTFARANATVYGDLKKCDETLDSLYATRIYPAIGYELGTMARDARAFLVFGCIHPFPLCTRRAGARR